MLNFRLSKNAGNQAGIHESINGGIDVFDALGSTVALTNAAETVTDTTIYDAFGNVISNTATTDQPFSWIGQSGYYFDSKTGLYILRRRPLNSTTSRFLSEDPIADDEVNLYRYVKNKSTTFVDPSGLIKVVPLPGENSFVCGGRARAAWNFFLDKKAPCDGYIIQKVTINCRIDWSCSNCPNQVFQFNSFDFWEAWFVKSTKKQWIRLGPFDRLYTDNSTGTYMSNTCGHAIKRGEIRFYCKDKNHKSAGGVGTGELGNLARGIHPDPKTGWKRRVVYQAGDCASTSGYLASTSVMPGFWSKKAVETGGYRHLALDWNCCPCQQNHVWSDVFPQLPQAKPFPKLPPKK